MQNGDGRSAFPAMAGWRSPAAEWRSKGNSWKYQEMGGSLGGKNLGLGVW